MENEKKSMNVDEEELEEGKAKEGEPLAKQMGNVVAPPQMASVRGGGGIGGKIPSSNAPAMLRSISDAKNGLSKGVGPVAVKKPVTTNGAPGKTGASWGAPPPDTEFPGIPGVQAPLRVAAPELHAKNVAARKAREKTQELEVRQRQAQEIVRSGRARSWDIKSGLVDDLIKDGLLLKDESGKFSLPGSKGGGTKKKPPTLDPLIMKPGGGRERSRKSETMGRASEAIDIPRTKRKKRGALDTILAGDERQRLPVPSDIAGSVKTQAAKAGTVGTTVAKPPVVPLLSDKDEGASVMSGFLKRMRDKRAEVVQGRKDRKAATKAAGEARTFRASTARPASLARSIESTHGDQMKKGFPSGGTCGLCKRISKSITENVCEDCQSSMNTTQWHTSHLG